MITTLDYLLADDTADPVVAAAIEQAERYVRGLQRFQTLTVHQAMVTTLLRRVRELEQENEELRRLR